MPDTSGARRSQSPTAAETPYRQRSPDRRDGAMDSSPEQFGKRHAQPVKEEVREASVEIIASPKSAAATQGLLSPLFRHQKEGLAWMRAKEAASWRAEDERLRPVYWLYRRIQPDHTQVPVWQHRLVSGMQVKQLARPAEGRGGIVADEMGLGKTLLVLAHVLRERAQSQGRPTLVVAPKTVLDEWLRQIQRHVDPQRLAVEVYLSGQKARPSVEELQQKHLVLTTYETLVFDGKGKPAHLEKTAWDRVVLDEGHRIRNRKRLDFQALSRLQAAKRWVLSGTPVQNSIRDLGALLGFLKIPGLETASQFTEHVVKPVQNTNDANQSQRVLNILQRSIVLRRLRGDVFGPESPIALPPLREDVVRDRMPPEDMAVYNAIAAPIVDAREQGVVALSSMAKLQRLRRICAVGKGIVPRCHVLVADGVTASRPIDLDADADRVTPAAQGGALGDIDEAHEHFQARQVESTPLCDGCGAELASHQTTPTLVAYLVKACGHSWCRACAKPDAVLRLERLADSDCNHCRAVRNDFDDMWALLLPRHERVADVAAALRFPKMQSFWQDVEGVVAKNALHVSRPPEKMLVFSSYTTVLDVASQLFHDQSLKMGRIDGSLSLSHRSDVLRTFIEDDSMVALLLTFGAGSEGLSVPRANHVFMLDGPWNPAVDLQALSRVHRPGQLRRVTIKRYIITGTIEDDILRIRQSKQVLADAAWAAGTRTEEQWAKELVAVLEYAK